MFSFLKKIPWWGWLGIGIGGYYLFLRKKTTYTGKPSADEPALTYLIPATSPLAKGLLPGSGGLYNLERTNLINAFKAAMQKSGLTVVDIDVQGYGPKVGIWATFTDGTTYGPTMFADNATALSTFQAAQPAVQGYW